MSVKPVFTGVQEGRTTPPLANVLTSVSQVSTQASATASAGGAGVRHVAARAHFNMTRSGVTGLAYGTVEARVIDGATAGSTFLFRSVLTINSNGIEPVTVELFAPGSAATALTVEFDAAVTNAIQSVHLTYFDVR